MKTRLPASPATRFLLARVFPWAFVVAGGVVLFLGIGEVRKAAGSSEWPSAEGVILASTVEFQAGKKGGGTYHARVRYAYEAEAKRLTGTRIAFGDYGSNDPSHARGIVERYPKGSAVAVRYRPSDPETAVLEPGLQGQAWFSPGLGLVFLLLGVGLVVGLPRVLPAGTTRLGPAGGAR
jgi:hypothetical protein